MSSKLLMPQRVCNLCIPIVGPSLKAIKEQITEASECADWLEFRFDLWDALDETTLEQLSCQIPIPVIYTLRKKSHGGKFKGSETDRLILFGSLLKFKPDMADIEGDIPFSSFENLKKISPTTKWIISWHDLEKTPDDLQIIYNKLTVLPGSYFKITTKANVSSDSLRMLLFTKKINGKKGALCGLCMGEEGQCTRILSPLVGNPFTFAALKEGNESAIGQLTVRELVHTYRFYDLNAHTLLLGLIGNPITQSKGHLIHNAALREAGINGVYVKFKVLDEELSQFFSLIKELNLRGLSVTMPYKEKVLSALDVIDESLSFIGACNTILFKEGKLTGCNTDGKGVVKALRMIDVANQKVVMIGAGGSAKAIAYEINKLGGELTILNRTVDKAQELALKLNAQWGNLDDMARVSLGGYAILIQTTQVGMVPDVDVMPIRPEALLQGRIVVDIIAYPQETLLLRKAKEKECQTISGLDVFVSQAVMQFSYWFEKDVHEFDVEGIMRKSLNLPKKRCLNISPSRLNGIVSIPSSKSHSIRAILLAAMVQGTSCVHNILNSPDVTQTIKSARQLGATITEQNNNLIIEGVGGTPQAANEVFDVGNSGQVLRFAAAFAAIGNGYVEFTGDHSIRTNRIVQPFLDGLQGLGVAAASIDQKGHAPFGIKGPMKAGSTYLSGEDSQPVSALLMAASFVEGVTSIHVKNPGEKPWIDLTLSWLDRLGVEYKNEAYEKYSVKGKKNHSFFNYHVPGDFSSAAFPVAAALITQSTITIENVDMDDVQGDKALIGVLQQMGACIEVDDKKKCLYVKETSTLKGCTIDVNPIIDAITILAVIGCFAEGETKLINGSIARHKECNRIDCVVNELGKMGADIRATEDGIVVRKSNLKGASVNSHGDHRMALSLIVAGMSAEGETLLSGVECMSKSYPTFVEDMRRLGATLKYVEN